MNRYVSSLVYVNMLNWSGTSFETTSTFQPINSIFFPSLGLHTRRCYFYTHVMTKNDDDSEILQGKNLPLKNVSSHFDLING